MAFANYIRYDILAGRTSRLNYRGRYPAEALALQNRFTMGMKLFAVPAALALIAILTVAVAPNPKNAMDVISRIKHGMTYADIAEIVPLNERHRSNVRENGGVFYDVPIDSKHLVQLRFEHPNVDKPVRDSKINYSPRLRNRQTLEFIAGDEMPWPTGN